MSLIYIIIVDMDSAVIMLQLTQYTICRKQILSETWALTLQT